MIITVKSFIITTVYTNSLYPHNAMNSTDNTATIVVHNVFWMGLAIFVLHNYDVVDSIRYHPDIVR